MPKIPFELLSRFTTSANAKSLFLSFEGIEGAGKSTQINTASNFLKSAGYDVLLLREPGGTEFGERLRSAILNSQKDLHPLSEAFLFASSRAQLLYEVILPKLKQDGTAVICDRYIDSSIAYQGYARKLGTQTVLEIHGHHPLTIVPHQTFYIKISPQTSLERQKIRNQKKDYFESKGLAFYESLVKGYEEAAALFPHRIISIDGEKDQTSVSAQLELKLKELIK
ncbi:MAG: dTMP kinase [Bdellovibrionales bacterium RIFOXYA1_FULL_36_14]|nr:MAG: dTMP kinase [Bdellovibrionales bacterium RIFOXYA1_FULL_36_14]